MYDLPYFKNSDGHDLLGFMREHPFVLLTGVDGGSRPVATHVPLLLEEREGKIWLRGHIMRQTDHHRAFEANPEVLAIFLGPHCYVSASWYSEPKTASTWNYMTVHAGGRLRFLGEEALIETLKLTTAHFEGPDSPSLVEKMAAGYVEKMARAIIAFEIEVTQLRHVFKLSQNRDQSSYDSIIRELEAQGGEPALIAREMSKRRSQLFKE
jgi:transcriptional regulator